MHIRSLQDLQSVLYIYISICHVASRFYPSANRVNSNSGVPSWTTAPIETLHPLGSRTLILKLQVVGGLHVPTVGHFWKTAGMAAAMPKSLENILKAHCHYPLIFTFLPAYCDTHSSLLAFEMYDLCKAFESLVFEPKRCIQPPCRWIFVFCRDETSNSKVPKFHTYRLYIF